MSSDFRFSQGQTNKIIASGSSGTSTGAKLVVYPISADEVGTPNQGYIDQAVFATGSVGTDIFLFVSGGIGKKGIAGSQSITVFGGDLHVSGNFTIDGSGGGSGGNSYWVSTVSDVILASGSVEHGSSVQALGDYSHAEGVATLAYGTGAHAEGDGAEALGGAAHAEGNHTHANTNYSHAEGINTWAIGENSHAEGNAVTASGMYSHAEGIETQAAGIGTHAEGYRTFASGTNYFTISLGNYSHAEGTNTVTVGSYSHAEGIGTIASGSGQLTVGKYNKRANDFSLFVIGDGTGDADASRSDIIRVNAGSVLGNGRVEVTGSMVATVGLSGSLTSIADGTRYLIAGTNITINTASNGSVEISGSAGTSSEYLPSLALSAGFDDFTDPAFPGWDVFRGGDQRSPTGQHSDGGKLMHFTSLAQFTGSGGVAVIPGSGLALLVLNSSSYSGSNDCINMRRTGEGLALDETVPVITEWRFAPITSSSRFEICDNKSVWAMGMTDFEYQELLGGPGINSICLFASMVTGSRYYQLAHIHTPSGGAPTYTTVEFTMPPAVSSYRMRLSALSGSSTLEIGVDDGPLAVSGTLSGINAPSASLYAPWVYCGRSSQTDVIAPGNTRILAVDYVGWSGKRAGLYAGAPNIFTGERYTNLLPGSVKDRFIAFLSGGVGSTESISRYDQMIRVSHGPDALSASLALPDSSNCNMFVIKKTSGNTGSIFLKPLHGEPIEGVTGSNSYFLTGSDAQSNPAWTVWSTGTEWYVA